MNTEQATAFFTSRLAEQLRQMPLSEAVPFLRGAVALTGEHPAMADLRGTLRELASADDQLELIAHPQQRLPLEGGR